MSRTTIAPAKLRQRLGGVASSQALEHRTALEALRISVVTFWTNGLL
jgi:hypothetical protein